MYYRATNSTIVAMINRVAKKPNETAKPTPESVASLRLLCTFFSNVFTLTPPNSHFSINQYN